MYGDIPANQAGILKVGRRVGLDMTDTVWWRPTLQGSFTEQWVTGSISDEDFDSVGYEVDQSGFVNLTGVIDARGYTTTFNAVNPGNLLFTIAEPSLRPATNCMFALAPETATANTTTLTILTDGTVWVRSTLAAGPQRIPLDNISWWVGTTNALTAAPSLAQVNTGTYAANSKMVQDQPVNTVGTAVAQTPWVVNAGTAPHSVYAAIRFGWMGSVSGPITGSATADTAAIRTSSYETDPNGGNNADTTHRVIYPCAGVTSGSPFIDRCDLRQGTQFVPEVVPQRAMGSTSAMYLNGIQGSHCSANILWGDSYSGSWGAQPANSPIFSSGGLMYRWAVEGWYDIPLTAPWTNYGTPYRSAQWMRDWYGNIYLRGLIKDGTTGTIALLPTGWRGGGWKSQHTVMTSQGVSKLNVSIANGLAISSGTLYTGGVGQWVSLSGVIIRT